MSRSPDLATGARRGDLSRPLRYLYRLPLLVLHLLVGLPAIAPVNQEKSGLILTIHKGAAIALVLLIMAHVGVTASLIPGSLIVDVDRDRRILFLHVIGVSSAEDVEKQHRAVQGWEARIVRAVGSRAQLRDIQQIGARSPREGGAPR